MTAQTVDEVLENIYTSLFNNNEGIDEHIESLKKAIAPSKEVTVDAARLVQPNREGRKMMQAYFKKRGIVISFAKKDA